MNKSYFAFCGCLVLAFLFSPQFSGALKFQLFLPAIIATTFLVYIFIENTNNDSGGMFSSRTIFLTVFYLFHIPYVLLYSIGVADYDKEVFYSESQVVVAVYYCTACMFAFTLGYGRDKAYSPKVYMPVKRSMTTFSVALLGFALICFWMPILVQGSSVFGNYRALINLGATSIGKLFWLSHYLFVAALACLYASAYSDKGIGKRELLKRYIAYPSLVPVSYLIIGDRGGFLSTVMIVLVFFHVFIYRVSLKNYVVGFVSIMVFSAVIAVARTTVTGDVFAMIEVFGNSDVENPLLHSLIEFGSSLKTVVIAGVFIPSTRDYLYGQTYIDSLISIIPQSITGYFYHPESESFVTWLTLTAFGDRTTWGRGGSIAMEAYANFGYLIGIAFFSLLGGAMKYIRLKSEQFYSGGWTIAYYASIGASMIWVRNTSSQISRMIVWSLIIYVLFRFLSSFSKKRAGAHS